MLLVEGGIKFDENKTRYTLLYPPFIKEMADVLTYGQKKYPANNWTGLAQDRLLNALYRHLLSISCGELIDGESGYSHYAHVAVNAMMLAALSKQGVDTNFQEIERLLKKQNGR